MIRQSNNRPHIPGEAGVWVFIMGDMVIFAMFFAVFTYYRGLAPELFAASQEKLNVGFGAFNTLLLLTSSWFAVMAVKATRRQLLKPAFYLFLLTFLSGAGFSVVKILEYSEKVNAGFYLTTNDFFMYYYIFTGIHFLHVIIGMVLLIFVMLRLHQKRCSDTDIGFYEVGASYWHMVDVLWIILFPLIYLMK
jgi:nitric oxide reductase NorE protein